MSTIIKSLRKDRGWTQEQLAEIADVSVRTIQRLERGGSCSLETAKALAVVFETRSDLFLDKDDTTAEPAEGDERFERIKTERRLRLRLKLYVHAAIYTVVNLMLIVINLSTNTEHIWFFYPMAGWGIGLTAHALRTFSPDLGQQTIDRMVDREMVNRGR